MKSVSKLALGLGLLVAVAAFVQPVLAGCPGSDPVFWGPATTTQVVSNPDWCGGGGCYSPYGTALATAFTDDMTATFWVAGQGNPAPGAGVDGGTLPRDAWVTAAYSYGYGDRNGYYGPYNGALYAYGMYMQSQGWNGGTYPGGNSAIDGCVSDSNGTGPRCLCVSFSDQIAGQGYFALLGGAVDPVTGNTLVQSTGTVQLQPIPRINIMGSTRMGEGVSLMTGLPAITDGVNDVCGCQPVGYNVYRRVQARGDMPPSDRRIAEGGWTLAGSAGAVDGMVQVDVDCTGVDSDVYLGASLVFPDGFETSVVSANSTRVECGPNLANPNPRTRPDRPVLRERGGRGR